MGRRAEFTSADFLGAALELAAGSGAQSVNVAAVASRLGAPTGSFYHRYDSRAALLGELWLDVVEEFQQGWNAALEGETAREAGLSAALFTPHWCRSQPLKAAVLALHHRRDFERDQWPAALKSRERRAARELGAGLAEFLRRLYRGAPTEAERALARFALIDAPLAAVRPYLEARKEIPSVAEAAIKATYLALIH
jgi:AcrR family transcriptional regulator